MDKHHDKLTKQELKTPDQFWQASKSAVTWMNSQLIPLVTVLVLIFVGVVGGIYYMQLAKKREGEAQFHFALAKSHYEQWKLAKPEDQATSEKALSAELEVLSSKFGPSRSNGLANLFRAEMALKKTGAAEAVPFYERYAAALPHGDQDLALLPLAKTYEDGKLWPKALESYEKILSQSESLFTEEAWLGKARALRNLERKPDAIKTYEAFLAKFPSSQEAANVRGLLASLKP